jgi:hypothetical protein
MKLLSTKLGKLFATAVAFMLLYSAAGFLIFPVILKGVAVPVLTGFLGRTVTIKKIDFNPYTLSTTIHGLQVAEPAGGVIFSWDALRTTFAPLSSLLSRTWTLKDTVLSRPEVNIARKANGTLNFADLLRLDWPRNLRAQVSLIRLVDGKINFHDAAVPGGFSTSISLAANVRDFSTNPHHTNAISVSAVSESGEKFSWRGSVFVRPVRSRGEIAVENVQIAKYAPYMKERLDIAAADGGLTARASYEVDLARESSTLLLHDGTLIAQSLTLYEQGSTVPFFGLAKLELAGARVDLLRQTIVVDSLLISGGSVILRRLADKSFNLQHILKPVRAPSVTAATPSATWSVAVGEIRLADFAAEVRNVFGRETVAWKEILLSTPTFQTNPLAASMSAFTLQEGKLTFTDPSVSPPVTIALTHVSIRVGGFSSADPHSAGVAISGEIDNTARLQISGDTNPMGADGKTSLRGLLRRVSLLPLGPYAAKYLGYELTAGELSLDVSYLIQGGKISARNSVEIASLTFGGKTESKEATKLPIRLAVFLLKDSHGNITLNIPIKWKPDDSTFEIQKALLDAVLRPFRKTATFPFAALGAPSGGEGLGIQEFSAGSAALDPQETGKLDTIRKGLQQWPELMLDVEGSVDAKKDIGDLHLLAFERARAVREYLLRQGTLEPDRIFLMSNSPENVPQEGSRALLFLKDRYRGQK